VLGLPDKEILEAALIECFGIEDNISFNNINQTLSAISGIYDELEMKKVTELAK